MVIETFSMPVQGDGASPEINRVSLWRTKLFQVLSVVCFKCVIKQYLFAAQIVSAVLSSIGLSTSGTDVVRVSSHLEL